MTDTSQRKQQTYIDLTSKHEKKDLEAGVSAISAFLKLTPIDTKSSYLLLTFTTGTEV